MAEKATKSAFTTASSLIAWKGTAYAGKRGRSAKVERPLLQPGYRHYPSEGSTHMFALSGYMDAAHDGSHILEGIWRHSHTMLDSRASAPRTALDSASHHTCYVLPANHSANIFRKTFNAPWNELRIQEFRKMFQCLDVPSRTIHFSVVPKYPSPRKQHGHCEYNHQGAMQPAGAVQLVPHPLTSSSA